MGARSPENLDLIVEAAVLAETHNLTYSQKSSIDLLESLLNQRSMLDRFGVLAFSVEHIQKLQPLFVKGLFSGNIMGELDVSDEDVRSCLFPKYFVGRKAHLLENHSETGTVCVSGTWSCADGDYTFAGWRSDKVWVSESALQDTWVGRPVVFSIERSELLDGDRVIVASLDEDANTDDEPPKVLWVSRYSLNFSVPPDGPRNGIGTIAKLRHPKVMYTDGY